MLKKNVTYTDYNGDQCVEDLYFNFSATELVEMNLSDNKLEDRLRQMMESKDNKQILAEFKKILMQAYGIRSADGKRFLKSEDASQQFTETAAYDALVIELLLNADAAAAFIEGLIPQEMLNKVKQSKLPMPQDKPSGPPPTKRTNAGNAQAAMPRPPGQ